MDFVMVEVTKAMVGQSDDVRRAFGPAYEVRDGLTVRGLVWREATKDANGRDIAVWWWAKKPGARVKILRSSTTRRGAAALL